MQATHAACALVLAGSGLSLWPLALIFALVVALPGMLTAWLGALLRRRRGASGPSLSRRPNRRCCGRPCASRTRRSSELDGVVDVRARPVRPSASQIEPDVGLDLPGIDARSLLKLDVERVGLRIVDQPHGRDP